MRFIIFVALAIGSPVLVTAQIFEWAKRVGSSSYDLGQCITTDASGNVYTTGRFIGPVDFDPNVIQPN